ncbi:MAG: hypothetical protein WEE51_11870 [Pirellulaceae bacterium]
MLRTRFFTLVLTGFLTVGSGLALPGWAVPHLSAAEMYDEFLEGLLQRGYYEQALWYLDELEGKSGLPEEIKTELAYRRGLAQIEASRGQRNPTRKTEYLASADKNLADFIAKNPDHEKQIDATVARGNVLLEQAVIARMQAERATEDAEKAPHLETVQKRYDEAREVFQTANDRIREVLVEIGNVLDPKKDAKKIAYRDELRSLYMQTMLLATTGTFEKAKTLAEDDPERKKLMEQSVKEFGETYGKYKSKIAGLLARLYQGQANAYLGNNAEAVKIFKDDLFLLPDRPEAFMNVKRRAVKALMEIWTDPEEKKYPQAIELVGTWFEQLQLRPADERQPDWLEMKLMLANAYHLDAEGREDKDPLKADHRKLALQLAGEVARFPSDFREEAGSLRAKLQGAEQVAEKDKTPPANFMEAYNAARESMSEAQSSTFIVNKRKEDLASAEDEETKTQIQGELDEAQVQIGRHYAQADEYFRLALALSDGEVTTDQLNDIRYRQGYIDFLQKRFLHTYVRANFIARRYPGSVVAKPAAKLALASALQEFQDSKEADRSFELTRIDSMVGFMAKQWPGQKETNDALSTLIGFQVQQAGSKTLPFAQRVDLLGSAEETLKLIADDSPVKAESELKVGQTYWSLYLRGNQLRREAAGVEDANGVPAEDQLASMKEKAIQILERGVEAYASETPNYSYALAALSLSQVHTEAGTPEKSFPLLEQEKTGLLTLVDAGNESVSRPGFPQLVYKSAVRAYISALPTQTDSAQTEALMKKAEAAMAQLKTLVGEDADGQRQLVAIYISLAKELQEQLDNAPRQSKSALAKAFEMFLSRVADSTSDPMVLNWVGDTFYNLGQSTKQDNSLANMANGFFEQGIAAYSQILENTEGQNPQLITQVRIRAAMAQRELGKYEEALATFVEVLKENNMLISVQVEAATTYLQWGVRAEDANILQQSMMGAEKDPATGRNIIWGWGQIQRMLARYASDEEESSPYRDTFFEARYNLALTRYEIAKAIGSPDNRRKALEYAERDITTTQLSYPSMGGELWYRKFDSLLRTIQSDLHGKATGLQASPETEASASR